MSVTRARFEANGKTDTEVKDALVEELRAFTARHRGARHWKAEEQIQTTANGYWGSLVLTPTDDDGYPERTTYDARIDG